MQSYSVLPSGTEVSMEGSTASMPGRGRSDSRPGTRETVLQYRVNLNRNWSAAETTGRQKCFQNEINIQ
jgi:hypothetical protein